MFIFECRCRDADAEISKSPLLQGSYIRLCIHYEACASVNIFKIFLAKISILVWTFFKDPDLLIYVFKTIIHKAVLNILFYKSWFYCTNFCVSGKEMPIPTKINSANYNIYLDSGKFKIYLHSSSCLLFICRFPVVLVLLF